MHKAVSEVIHVTVEITLLVLSGLYIQNPLLMAIAMAIVIFSSSLRKRIIDKIILCLNSRPKPHAKTDNGAPATRESEEYKDNT